MSSPEPSTKGQSAPRRMEPWVVLPALVVLAFVLRVPHSVVLNIDEARYVTAARQGFLANALDIASLDPGDFLAFALSKWRKAAPVLPAGYDEEADPFLLRNLHPPFTVYTIVPVSATASERDLRMGQLLGGAGLVVLLILVHGRLAPRLTWEGALVVGVLGLWAARLGFAAIHTHGWMALWTTAFVVLLARWFDTGNYGRPCLSCCITLALALATLHTAVISAIGAAVVLAFGTPSRSGWPRPRLSVVMRAALLVALLTALLWPGAIIKIGYAKIFALYAYLLMRGQEWSQAADLRGQMAIALLPLLLLAPAAVLWLRARGGVPRSHWIIPVVCGLPYLAVVGRHLVAPWYALPGLVPFIPLVGWWIDAQQSRLQRALLTGVCILLVAFAWRGSPTYDPTLERGQRADIERLRETAAGCTLLADTADVYRLYLPEAHIIPLFVEYQGALVLREHGRYRPVTSADARGRLVLVRAHRPPAGLAILEGCKLENRPSLRIFDCRS